MHANNFIDLIKAGRITDAQGLKDAYRALVMRTHPDRAGSRFAETFIRLEGDYQEAMSYLRSSAVAEGSAAEVDHRLAFYKELQKIDRIESPYYLEKEKRDEQLAAAETAAADHFGHWHGERIGMYRAARSEYALLRKEKRRNIIAELYKPLLFQSIRPFYFNIIYYQLSGHVFYTMQIERLQKLIRSRLAERGLSALGEFTALLIDDVKNGPAIFS